MEVMIGFREVKEDTNAKKRSMESGNDADGDGKSFLWLKWGSWW